MPSATANSGLASRGIVPITSSVLASTAVQAQTFPDKPIHMIVPFTAGSATALAAVAVVAAGCILPYVHYTGDTTGINPSPSIFNGGFSGACGDVTEPAVVILFSIVASILALASTSSLPWSRTKRVT